VRLDHRVDLPHEADRLVERDHHALVVLYYTAYTDTIPILYRYGLQDRQLTRRHDNGRREHDLPF
jgi:hypothetical protein